MGRIFAWRKGVYMLEIRNLKLTHIQDSRVILEDFSMVLNPGDRAVIIGEEGNGKSTLLKWIFDPESVSDYMDVQGEMHTGKEVFGYLPQQLPEEDKNRSVWEFFSEEERFPEQTPAELGRLAADFSLAPEFFFSDQKMETLSGGEKVKAQLMRIMMRQPTVYLLDEPSNDLDIETLQWLEDFICGCRETVLFISHDEVLIEHAANMIIHLEQIRRKMQSRHSVRHMTYGEYVRHRNAQMQNQEDLAYQQRRRQKIREEKLRRIEQKVEHDQTTISRQDPHGGALLKKKMKAVKSMERRFEREKEDIAEKPETETAILIRFDPERSYMPEGKTVLDLQKEKIMCPDGTRILSENIALNVRGPEKICIIGKNGCGKSTLLKMIAEELTARKDLRAFYMPQNYDDLLYDQMTPPEYLSFSREKEEYTKIRTWLGSMKYTADEMNHRICDLSGGQKAKLFFLKMNLAGANVLILDEPTRNFSPLSGPVIRTALKTFPGSIISVSHDRKYISEVCERILRMDETGLHEISMGTIL